MTKIKNPILFTEYFNIDVNKMKALDIFNPILNVDTQLFIDPVLLRRSKDEIIKRKAVRLFKKKFENVILLLLNSTRIGDIAWKNALRLIPKKEVVGTCLGYGVNSITGRSISEKIRELIITTASEIVKLGIKDPDLFILLPLLEDGIGPDTISDITASAIEDSLIEFTSLKAKQLGINTITVNYKGKECEIIRNPLIKGITPILLLPKDILRHLPVVSSWDEIADAASFNQTVRNNVNKMISIIWRARTKQEKAKVKHEIFRNKEWVEQLLLVLKNGDISPYNLEKDNRSLIAWQNFLSVSHQYPLKIENIQTTESGLKDSVLKIIEQFQFLVEEKGLNKLFWKEKNQPNKEKVVQMIFFAVAYSYCKANNIDINPEMDTGNGNVDFKFSKGFSKRLIVEIKNSYNSNIISGFKTQLETYKKSEETCYGYYIIIDVGSLGNKYITLRKMYSDDNQKKAQIILIDGIIKLSASKRK